MYKYVQIEKDGNFLHRIFRAIRKSFPSVFLFFLILCSVALMLLDLRHATVVQDIRRTVSFVITQFIEISTMLFVQEEIDEVPDGMEIASKLLVCRSENKALRKLLNFVERHSKKFFSTRIIGNIRDHTFVAIRSGNVDVKPNQLVVNEKGVIGKVISVDNNLITGILVTHPHFRIPVISVVTQLRFVVSGTGEHKKLAASYLEGSLIDGELVLSTIGQNENLPIAIFDSKSNRLEVLFNHRTLNLISVLLDDE